MEMNDVRGVWNQCYNAAGLGGMTGGATTYTTTALGDDTGLLYTIGGKFYYSADDTATEVPDLDITTGVAFEALDTGEGCLFVFCLDSSQVMKVAQGPVVKTADVTNKSAVYEFPSIPDTVTPIGYNTISYVGSSTWTFGTSNWNASTTTLGTPVDCAVLPTQPLTAAL